MLRDFYSYTIESILSRSITTLMVALRSVVTSVKRMRRNFDLQAPRLLNETATHTLPI